MLDTMTVVHMHTAAAVFESKLWPPYVQPHDSEQVRVQRTPRAAR